MSVVQVFTYRSKIAAKLAKIPQNSKHEIQKVVVAKNNSANIELKEGTIAIIKEGHSPFVAILKEMFTPNKIQKPIELHLDGKGDAFVSGNHKIISNEAGYIKSRATGDVMVSNAEQLDIQNASKVKVSNTQKLSNIESASGDVIVADNKDKTVLNYNKGNVTSYSNIGDTEAYGNHKDVSILYNIGDAAALNTKGDVLLEGNFGTSAAIGSKQTVTFVDCKDRIETLNDGKVNIIA